MINFKIYRKNMRNGFSLIAAIIFVLLISSLGALSISLTSTTAKQTGDIFAKEQGELMLEGYAEYVMLRILKHDFTTGCLERVIGQTQGGEYSGLFKMEAYITYYGSIGACGGNASDPVININTPQTKGTVVIDIFATHTNSTNSNDISTLYPVRLHKKIIQKI